MNHKAIDAGATAFVKFDVPADWATPRTPLPSSLEGQVPSWSSRSRRSWSPSAAWTATACPFPPSSICADGQFELGASAYEKRGVAVSVPHWDADQVHPVQPVRLCVPACHHPSVRADRRGGRRRPEASRIARRMRPQGQGHEVHHGHQSRSTAWAAASASRSAPGTPSTMVPTEEEMDQQPVFDYCVEQRLREEGAHAAQRQGQPVQAALLEFSGSCAGCAETAYARLVTQLVRRPHVHLQRHRLLLHLGRPRCHRSLLHGQGRSRPGVEQLPVRGQRRARSGHGRWL